ncbi:DUF2236 domain-containing protein [Orrella sp. NBD-18]|uniref:DUF2236 domain-containing protein n=1 Tax=Sheuella amnicola TaxID=2707330 RepID=A0A6B2RAZ2_9BURK|nr:oxygenase MpaB family protein [Sheuella amnicola]NDY84445.1 DUF2236 domain-containing protein [Sheuella amnicola]
MFGNLIRKTVWEMVGESGPPVKFLTPKGDRGLFGPDSVVWIIHADFITMMIGGISSLILQALHPQALAGIWDHSSFREDLKGRLSRTAYFIAATTYGPTDMANQVIDRVNHIHSKISGSDEFGKPYSATDPHLLAWVHLTETRSFMCAYEHHRKNNMTINEKNKYFFEMKTLGERMGAINLPSTYDSTENAIKNYIPELYYGDRAKSIIHLLENFPGNMTTKPFINLISRASFMNLPDWVYPLINRARPTYFERLTLQKSIGMMAIPVRKALKDGVAAHSIRRVYG